VATTDPVLVTEPRSCVTHDCGKLAAFVIDWPGQPDQPFCASCADRAVKVTRAIGIEVAARPVVVCP
jgi:hypothetical protein